jgi:hypothetical protein
MKLAYITRLYNHYKTGYVFTLFIDDISTFKSVYNCKVDIWILCGDIVRHKNCHIDSSITLKSVDKKYKTPHFQMWQAGRSSQGLSLDIINYDIYDIYINTS